MSDVARIVESGPTTDTEDITLRVMMAAAAYQARRVARTLKLSTDDREDAEHEILMVLLERRRFFNPTRGPWTPFAHRIARQAAQSVADELVAARKLYSYSLNQPASNTERGEDELNTLEEAFSDLAAPSETDLLDALSILTFVKTLPNELRIVAEAALQADGELPDAQRAVGLSTSEFYRRMREIRYRLFAVGLVDRRKLLEP